MRKIEYPDFFQKKMVFCCIKLLNIAEPTLFASKKHVAFISRILVAMGKLKNEVRGWVNIESRFEKASCEYSFVFYKIETEITPLNASSAFLLKFASIKYA